jgi:ATP adenylyltransferase
MNHLGTDSAKEPPAEEDCVFCNIRGERKIFAENEYAISFPDNFPATEGHTLFTPKRHVADYFELDNVEVVAINELLHIRRKQLLESDKTIKGFNIGVNVGHEAGQSVMHCHIHLIPRREGEDPAPKGKIRCVIHGNNED